MTGEGAGGRELEAEKKKEKNGKGLYCKRKGGNVAGVRKIR